MTHYFYTTNSKRFYLHCPRYAIEMFSGVQGKLVRINCSENTVPAIRWRANIIFKYSSLVKFLYEKKKFLMNIRSKFTVFRFYF